MSCHRWRQQSMKSVLVVLLSFWVSLFVTSVWQHMMCFIGTEADLCESTWTQHRHKSPATEIHTKQRFNPTIKQELPLALNCTQGAALSLVVARHTTVLWIRPTSPPITAQLFNHQASGFTNGREESSTILAYRNETNLRNWEFGKRTCLSLSNSNVIVKLAF